MLDKTTTASHEKGPDLNTKKTECIVTSTKSDGPLCRFMSQGDSIKQVNTLKYQGYSLNNQVKSLPEVKKRIALAKNAFNRMKPIMKDKYISIKTKMKIFKTYV